jgi:hypothetical protein
VHAQAAGHAEMQQQRVGAQSKEEVLASAIDAIDGPAGDQRRQLGGNRPAKARVVHAQRAHPLSRRVWLDPATGGFDLRQFGHAADGPRQTRPLDPATRAARAPRPCLLGPGI